MSVIPNVITILRLLLTIPIGISIYLSHELFALCLLVLAGFSDALDGYLARKYNWTSKFGEFADPMADKCLILSTLLALAFSGNLAIWIVSLMLVRDAVIVIGVLLYFSLFESYNLIPNRWGKHYTGWSIALFMIILLREVFLGIPMLIEQIAHIGVILFLVLSLVTYLNRPGREILKQII